MGKLITFDPKGNEKQLLAASLWADNFTEEIIYGGSKGSGKSLLGCSMLSGDALLYPGTLYFVARKELNDLRKFTLASFYEALTLMGVGEEYYRFNGQDNFIEFYNGSRIYFLAAKYLPSDPLYERFGSMQMTRGWIEEAGEIEEEARNNLLASVGRWKNKDYGIIGKTLETCNPTKNYLYEIYLANKNGTLGPKVKFVQALPEDNKCLPDDYLKRLHRILTDIQKERLLYGNWEWDDDPTTLCDYGRIVSIFENDHVIESDKYLTADIARFGSDKAVILVWSGWKIIDLLVFDISATTEIQNAIKMFRDKYQIPKRQCIADQDGVGGGVVDNTGILGFYNSHGPLDEKAGADDKEKPDYNKLPDQCGFGLARIINAYLLHIAADISAKHREEIIQELEQLKIDNKTPGTKLKLVSKESIKGKIGRSPDWLDAMKMRYYFELKPKSRKVKAY